MIGVVLVIEWMASESVGAEPGVPDGINTDDVFCQALEVTMLSH